MYLEFNFGLNYFKVEFLLLVKFHFKEKNMEVAIAESLTQNKYAGQEGPDEVFILFLVCLIQ